MACVPFSPREPRTPEEVISKQDDTAVTQTQPRVPTCALGAPSCNWNPVAQSSLILGEKSSLSGFY